MGVTGLHSFGKVGNHKVPVGLAKKQVNKDEEEWNKQLI